MKPERARVEDETAIKQLLALCDLPYADITVEHLLHFWVMRDKGRLFAAVGLQVGSGVALLRSLAVAPSARGLGLGKELLHQAEVDAQSIGVETIYLLTETAQEFFAHHGYRTSARAAAPPFIRATAEFSELCPDRAECMVKRISP
jgi:amino-acid N-acetyltransferase